MNDESPDAETSTPINDVWSPFLVAIAALGLAAAWSLTRRPKGGEDFDALWMALLVWLTVVVCASMSLWSSIKLHRRVKAGEIVSNPLIKASVLGGITWSTSVLVATLLCFFCMAL